MVATLGGGCMGDTRMVDMELSVDASSGYCLILNLGLFAVKRREEFSFTNSVKLKRLFSATRGRRENRQKLTMYYYNGTRNVLGEARGLGALLVTVAKK